MKYYFRYTWEVQYKNEVWLSAKGFKVERETTMLSFLILSVIDDETEILGEETDLLLGP